VQSQRNESQKKQEKINYPSKETGLIRNFLANGCSFTEYAEHPDLPDGKHKTWATYLSEAMAVENHINLASSGAGNDYICHSTINYLENADLDPEQTLVIVMWSGIYRTDLPMSQAWYNHFKFGEHTVCKTDGISYWINSGGFDTGWRKKPTVKPIFEHVYKITEAVDHCMKSLRYFVMLESYLKSRGYKFLFTSYINYWQDNLPYYVIKNEPPFENKLTADPLIGYHCKDYPILKKFDFSNWFFVNDQRDTICEFSHTQDPRTPRDNWHPSYKMHQKFAEEIVLPRVQQIHV